jgi:hypothetical protein
MITFRCSSNGLHLSSPKLVIVFKWVPPRRTIYICISCWIISSNYKGTMIITDNKQWFNNTMPNFIRNLKKWCRTVGATSIRIPVKNQNSGGELKSVNSNFTLAVHSPKLWQAKTHFLSHHNVCYINRFANFLTMDQWSNG